ncbi:MAG: flagellar hook-basal body complex protein, partial [Wenzhouxiangella sp.]
MPFQIALSGLNAASTSLSNTANNIANVNTAGFKKSRANFVELFATGLQNVSTDATGLGARTSSIQQQFSQGSLEFSDNNLDLALVGGGFFTLADTEGSI